MWHLLALSVVNGSIRSTQMPASQALLPNTLPRERLFNAVTLYGVTQHGSRFVGPFVILVVLWLTGHQEWVFFLCAGLYCLGLGLILSMGTRSRGAVETGRGMGIILRNVVEGLRYMYHNPLVLSLVLLVVAHCGMTMSFESLFPVLSQNHLGMEGSEKVLGSFSYLMVAYGAAAFVTALFLAGVQTESTRGRLFLWLGVLSGVTPLALAISLNLSLAMLGATAMGFSQGGFMMLSQAMVQAIVPDAVRGRVMGVYSWHIQGFMASFNLVNGTLAGVTALTAPMILGAGAIGFLVVMAMSFGRVPLRQIYTRGVPAT